MKVKSKFGLLALGLALAAGSLIGCKTGGGGGKPTPIRYEVSWNESSLYTVTGIDEDGYLKGDDVNFTITLANPDDYRVTSVTSDEVNIHPANRGLDYTFKMPAEDVDIRISTEQIPKWVANLKIGEEEVDGMEAEYELKYGTNTRTAFTIEADPAEATVNNTTHKVLFNKTGDVVLTFKDGGEVRTTYTAHPRAAQEGETRKTAITGVRAVEIGKALPDPTSYSDKGIGSTSTDRLYWIEGIFQDFSNTDKNGNHIYHIEGGFEIYGIKTLPEGVTAPEDLVGAKVVVQAKIEKFSFNSGSSFVYENDTFNGATKVTEIDTETLTGLKLNLDPAYSLQDGTLQISPVRQPVTSNAPLSFDIAPAAVASIDEHGLITFNSAGEATVTVSNAEANVSITKSFTIVDGEVGSWYRIATAPEAGSNYRLVLDRENAATNGGNWYLSGGTGSADYYLSTSKEEADALTVTVIEATGGFKLKTGDKYLFVGEVGTHKNSLYKDTEAEATIFSFDEALGLPYVTIGTSKYWLGNDSAKTFTEVQARTISATSTDYKTYLECFGVEPEPPALEGVAVSPATATINIASGNLTKQFTASPLPAKAELGEVTWTVEPEAQGVVVGDGLVSVDSTAVAEDADPKEFRIYASVVIEGTVVPSEAAILTVKNDTAGGGGTEDNPFTVDQARQYIDDNTTAGSISTDRIYVAGIVASKGTYSTQFNNFEIFFQSEDGLDEKYFESYHTVLANDITYDSINPGDYVVVEGLAKVYNGQYQLTDDAAHENNPTVVSVEDRDPVLLGIKLNDTSVTVGDSKTLTVLPIPSYATLPSGTPVWTSSDSTKASIGESTGVLTGVSVTEEGHPVTITATLGGKVAQCDVVVEEGGYTKATMAKGTSAYDDVTVNGEGAIKIGTSSAGGTMTITVGAGATTLVVYAGAWNGVSGLSLDITGATTDPTSIALTACSAFAGSGKAYSVTDDTAYKFVIALSGITQETTLTLTTSLAKRCVVWGAQYK